MIELDKDDLILSFWVAEVPDFFACVWRAPGDPHDEWRLVFRTRRHVDTKVFDSDDEKRWYRAILRGGVDTIRHTLNEAGAAARMQGYREIPINGFFDEEAMDKLTADRHVYVRQYAKGKELPYAGGKNPRGEGRAL